MRAFSVLALIFLSFGHQPLAFDRYGVSEAVTAAIYCGSALSGDPADTNTKPKKHSAVCRVATALGLPEPSSFLVPAPVALGCCTPDFAAVGVPASRVISGGGPRAPPVLAFV